MTTISVNHTRLYYESHGNGHPILFIHGLGSSTQDWEHQLQYFVNDYRVIMLDLRGHGQSDKPGGDYNVPLLTEDVAKLLKQVGETQVHVVGLSLGGWVAYQLAVDFPKLVRSLVVVNCLPELVAHSFSDRVALLKRTVLFRLLSMRTIGKVLAKKLFPKDNQKELRKIFIERWARNDKRAYMATMRGAVGWSVVDRLGEIQCPCNVISAEHDYFPIEKKQKYVSLMPNAKLVVIEGCGHAVPFECPEVFNKVLFAALGSEPEFI